MQVRLEIQAPMSAKMAHVFSFNILNITNSIYSARKAFYQENIAQASLLFLEITAKVKRNNIFPCY